MPSGRLNRLNLAVMKAVWRLGRATVNDVLKQLDGRFAYTTIATTLKHLEKHGYVTHEVEGRTYVYRPLVREEEVSSSMVGDLLDRLFDGSVEQLVNTLLEHRKISPEELDRVERLIADYRKEQRDE